MRIYKKRERKLTNGQDMVATWLGRLGFDARHVAVFDMWDRMLGRESEKAKAVGLKGQRLCVQVDSHARMHDLLLRKRTLLKQLNDYFGKDAPISDIILELSTKE
jgi:predicted nucleic acid-binding Zn ribbon protein